MTRKTAIAPLALSRGAVRLLVLGLALAALPAAAGAETTAPPERPAFNGWTGPKPESDCRCRHPDGYASIGERRCVRRGGRMVTAECRYVLNNTNWRVISDGCAPPPSV